MLRLMTLLPALLGACTAPPVKAPEPAPVVSPPPAPTEAAPAPDPGLRVDDETWFPYAGVSLADRRGTALDASALLDAPAGKHGELRLQGDGFVFADGSRARFWGMSIDDQMNFPSAEQADFMAEFCAQLGFNLTRHALPSSPLSPELWQRFDTLVAKLVARGIYIALSVDAGSDERFVVELLGHKNTHTGKTYGEDPAVVMLAIPAERRQSAAGFHGLVTGGTWTLAQAKSDGSRPVVETEASLIHEIAHQRTPGGPLLGEWSSEQPLYKNDALVMMAAYSGLHGWSAVMDSLGTSPMSEGDQLGCKLDGTRYQSCQGGVLALWPALSRLFHRRHVKESSVAGAPPALAYVAKSTATAGDGEPLQTQWQDLFSRYVKGTIATSVTGELVTDFGKGLFKLDTPRSQGVAGITLGKKESVSNLSVSVKNQYATVIATSLDDKPLARSARILISAVGNAANRGALLASDKQRFQESGGAPVMLEPMLGTVELTGLTGYAANASVHYLSLSGQRLGSVPIQTGPGIVRFEMKSEYRTLHYEVVRAP